MSESSTIKKLKQDYDKERIMRLKANQKLALLEKLFSAKLRAMNVKIDDLTDGKFEEIQKRMQRMEAVENKFGKELDILLRQNIELKRKIKSLTRTKKVSKKINKLIDKNIDEQNRKILKSNEPKVLFDGYLLIYSKKRKKYESKWCKLTNDGELLLFEDENAKEMDKMFDLVSIYDQINDDAEDEFELVSGSKPNYLFRSDPNSDYDDLKEWIGKIKVVQYYFRIKSEHHLDENDDDENENQSESDNEEQSKNEKKEEMKDEIEKKEETKKVIETDPFWLDICQKMEKIDHEYIKKCVPSQEEMANDGKKKWKRVLWKAEYGVFELSSNVQLVCHDTGKWTKEDMDLLTKSVEKHGINSQSSWQHIADDLNRDVNDVMKKYAKFSKIKLKDLRKLARTRD